MSVLNEFKIKPEIDPYHEEDDDWRIRPTRYFAPSNIRAANPASKNNLEKLYMQIITQKETYDRVFRNAGQDAHRELQYNRLIGIGGFGYVDIYKAIVAFDEGEIAAKKHGINQKLLDTLQSREIGTYFGLINKLGPDKIEAFRKSVQLCKKWLTKSEWEELSKTHQVTIKSKKYKNRYYVVNEKFDETVKVFEGSSQIIESCGLVRDYDYPAGDSFLAKVMAIKTDEDYFLKESNNTYFKHQKEFEQLYSRYHR